MLDSTPILKDMPLCLRTFSGGCSETSAEWYVYVTGKNRKITPRVGEKYNTRDESMYTKHVIGYWVIVNCRILSPSDRALSPCRHTAG